jgi:hypothetical protein
LLRVAIAYFFLEYGLGYNLSSQEPFWTDNSTPEWSTTNLQCSEKITINLTSNKTVKLNLITQQDYRISDACEAEAALSSREHMVQERPGANPIKRLLEKNAIFLALIYATFLRTNLCVEIYVKINAKKCLLS